MAVVKSVCLYIYLCTCLLVSEDALFMATADCVNSLSLRTTFEFLSLVGDVVRMTSPLVVV